MTPSYLRSGRGALVAAGLAGALLLAGCGGDADTAGQGNAPSAAPSAGMSMPIGGSVAPQTGEAVDRGFLTGMVPHHQSASDMAKVEVQKGKNPQVKELAQRIIDAQGAEIQQMTTIAKNTFNFTPSTQMMAMTHEMMGMTVTMDMAADMRELESATDVDKTFLQMMLPHHASAIVMADQEVRRGSNAEVKAIAQKIISDQAKEIGEIQQLLTTIG
jgi:uncharacterized protein (DUF305 family)